LKLICVTFLLAYILYTVDVKMGGVFFVAFITSYRARKLDRRLVQQNPVCKKLGGEKCSRALSLLQCRSIPMNKILKSVLPNNKSH